jgi:hypothetical protein
MTLSLTDLESKELGDLAHLGEARLGSEDTVAPISFLDFDEKGDPREIRGTIPARDLIGNTDTVGQSAINKAKTVYKGMGIKDRATMRGMLGVDEAGAIKVMAESYAQDLVKDLLKPRSFFQQDGENLRVGTIGLSNITVDGKKGATDSLQLPEVKKSGFFGLPFKLT